MEHIRNEKRVLEQVSHPFLVNLYATFRDERHLYMVMDYVPGGELFTLLRRSGRFSHRIARFYAAEILLAFEHLHSKNFVYRDLKPENLLIGKDGHIKITDFGFSKYVSARSSLSHTLALFFVLFSLSLYIYIYIYLRLMFLRTLC